MELEYMRYSAPRPSRPSSTSNRVGSKVPNISCPPKSLSFQRFTTKPAFRSSSKFNKSSKQTTSLSAGHSSSQSIFTRVAWPFRKVLKLWRSLGIGWLDVLVNGLNIVVTTWYDKHLQYFSNHPKWCRMFFLHQRYRNGFKSSSFRFHPTKTVWSKCDSILSHQNIQLSGPWSISSVIIFQKQKRRVVLKEVWSPSTMETAKQNPRWVSAPFGPLRVIAFRWTHILHTDGKGICDLLNHLQTGYTNLPEGYRSSNCPLRSPIVSTPGIHHWCLVQPHLPFGRFGTRWSIPTPDLHKLFTPRDWAPYGLGQRHPNRGGPAWGEEPGKPALNGGIQRSHGFQECKQFFPPFFGRKQWKKTKNYRGLIPDNINHLSFTYHSNKKPNKKKLCFSMTLLDFWRSMLSVIHHPDLLQISIDRLHRGLPADWREGERYF